MHHLQVYSKISGHASKFLDISGQFLKYQEFQDNARPVIDPEPVADIPRTRVHSFTRQW